MVMIWSHKDGDDALQRRGAAQKQGMENGPARAP